jgi:hypothetical protein
LDDCFPLPIPAYPMGEDFVPYLYSWEEFLSRTLTLIGSHGLAGIGSPVTSLVENVYVKI